MSLFITFEGIEGSGKTTQIPRLAQHLRARGLTVLITREPGGCAIADAIRAILLDANNAALVPRAELLLYAAARAQHVDEVIRPALARGEVVLCDRFNDATLAYQGFGRNLPRGLIDDLNRVAVGELRPDLTLLFDLSVEAGLARAMRRIAGGAGPAEDRFEKESLDFHQRIRAGYLQLAREDSARFRLIDAAAGPDEVEKGVIAAVDGFLTKQGLP